MRTIALLALAGITVTGCTSSERVSLTYPPERYNATTLRNHVDDEQLRGGLEPMLHLVDVTDPALKPETTAACSLVTDRGFWHCFARLTLYDFRSGEVSYEVEASSGFLYIGKGNAVGQCLDDLFDVYRHRLTPAQLEERTRPDAGHPNVLVPLK